MGAPNVKLLVADYTEQRSCIRLTADLDRGWRSLGKDWGFDQTEFLPYSGDLKFRCRIRVSIGRPRDFTPVEWDWFDGVNSFQIRGYQLQVLVPLDQEWHPTKNLSKNPCVYFETLKEFEHVYAFFRTWVVCRGLGKMWVKDQYEYGDGKSLIGGRPESNRRRF